MTGWLFMDHESRRIPQAKVADLPDRSSGVIAKQLVGQSVYDDSWKRKPGDDESGDDHVLLFCAKKSRKPNHFPFFMG